ncbi:MAG TPA: A24 family peptidase [Phycisphaerae bacterium]
MPVELADNFRMTPQLIIVLTIFFFLVGACVGSFLNVVIWRLPHRGREVMYLGKKGRMTLSWPPSHCPMCDKPIEWYRNIPVLSYILLRGKCANCRAAIPIRYPLVELATSLLWGGMFLAYFVSPVLVRVYPWQQGVGITTVQDGWPVYVLHVIFASALLAASAIDADLFIIPLAITWFLAIWGLLGTSLVGPSLTKSFAIIPALAPAGWALAKPVIGAVIGLIIANLLLMLKILPRSFPWEFEVQEEKAPSTGTADSSTTSGKADEKSHPKPGEELLAPPPRLTKFGFAVAGALAVVALIIILWFTISQFAAAVAGIAGAIVIFLIGVLPRDAGQIDVTDDVVDEISVEGVRKEMFKEILFLAIPAACAGLAYILPFDLPQVPWLMRLLGSLLGLLTGGAVVWLIRVGGSIAFNKQAMGIGDVHLMAGIGAVIGAPLVLIAFFTAPFVGILWAMVLKILRKPNVLPYGPWLSVASIMVIFVGNPLICWWLNVAMGMAC